MFFFRDGGGVLLGFESVWGIWHMTHEMELEDHLAFFAHMGYFCD